MKKGFTLAEVLITLGIIGVVAALTMPSLNLNVGTSKIETQFMKGMNTLQTAIDLVAARSGSDNLDESCNLVVPEGISDTLESDSEAARSYLKSALDCVAPYLRGYRVDDTKFITKDGMEYYFAVVNSPTYGEIDIYLDINGSDKGPNLIGKDQFVFELYPQKLSHDLIPSGSMATYNLFPSYSRNHNNWQVDCNSSEVKNPFMCSGSIFDNGGKVTYPWNSITSSNSLNIFDGSYSDGIPVGN